MGVPVWILLAALFTCVALSAFFSASETAYAAASRLKLKTMVAEGRRNAATALKLSEEYDRLLTCILVGNNVVNIAATSMATLLFTLWARDYGVTLSTIVMTLLILLFGEITPKTLAKEAPEKVALAVARPLSLMVAILYPVTLFFAGWKRLMHRYFTHTPDVSRVEAEIMTMVDEAQHEGDLEKNEGELIRSAIEFHEQDAMAILTHRVDVTALEDTATMEEAANLFRESGYSRLPVYHEDMDHVVGILHEKDFYRGQHEGCSNILDIMVPPVLAPATIRISKLLKVFQESKTHMVILLDEFGGTEGLVTMEDVLEELVGDIYDEHDEVDEAMVAQPDGSYLVDGSMQLTEMLTCFKLEDIFEADTVGGWAAEMLGEIPSPGDTFDHPPLTCQVVEMDKRRVTRLMIRDTSTAAPPSDEEAAVTEDAAHPAPDQPEQPNQHDPEACDQKAEETT